MASLVSSSWLHPPLPHPHRHTGCHPRLKTTWKANPPQRQHRDLCFMAKAKAGAGHSPVPWEPWASHHRPKLNTKMQGKETLHPINLTWLLFLPCWLWEANTCYYIFYSTSLFFLHSIPMNFSSFLSMCMNSYAHGYPHLSNLTALVSYPSYPSSFPSLLGHAWPFKSLQSYQPPSSCHNLITTPHSPV